MVALSAKANACTVPNFRYVGLEQAVAATPPLMGFVGRVVGFRDTERGLVRIVEIVVTADFTGLLPRTIYVRDVGLCGYSLPGEFGAEVTDIVRVGESGIYYLG